MASLLMKIILQHRPSDISLERAKEMLRNEIANSFIKRVRVSMDVRSSSNPNQDYEKRPSNYSVQEATHVVKKPSKSGDDIDNISVEEVLKRSRSLIGSSASLKTFNSIPKFILDNINDEKKALKYDVHKIDIEVINLVMCEDSSLLKNDSANFLFVEYTFLNYKGHLLETQSLPKPKKSGECTYYHFKRTFELRPSENQKQFKMLKIMLEKNSKQHLKFLIVNEPISEDTGDCEEVGFGIAKLCKLVDESTEDAITAKIECFSTEYPHELIAYINIRITGALIMKKLRKLK